MGRINTGREGGMCVRRRGEECDVESLYIRERERERERQEKNLTLYSSVGEAAPSRDVEALELFPTESHDTGEAERERLVLVPLLLLPSLLDSEAVVRGWVHFPSPTEDMFAGEKNGAVERKKKLRTLLACSASFSKEKKGTFATW